MNPLEQSATPNRRSPASGWFCGWLVRAHYDREGYWITDKAGYRNTLTMALTRITDPSGQVARRIVLWRFMLEWAKPQNAELSHAQTRVGERNDEEKK